MTNLTVLIRGVFYQNLVFITAFHTAKDFNSGGGDFDFGELGKANIKVKVNYFFVRLDRLFWRASDEVPKGVLTGVSKQGTDRVGRQPLSSLQRHYVFLIVH